MNTPSSLRQFATRAATMAERLAAVRDRAGRAVDVLGTSIVVDTWKTALATSAEGLATRLTWDGLTPADAEAAGNETVDTGPPVEWVDLVAEVQADAVRLAAATGADRPRCPKDPAIPEPPFVELLMPWLLVAQARVDRRSAHDDSLPSASLQAQLLHELGVHAGRALLASFHAFREQSVATAGDRYASFVDVTLGCGLSPVLDAFPVLVRQMAWIVTAWVEAVCDLRARLALDRDVLAHAFWDGCAPPRLRHIEPAASDPHDGRRRVMILTFDDGVRVVYKPRDITIEHACCALLDWARDTGLEPAQRSLRVLPQPGYGWVEFACAAEGFSDTEARAYYRRAGGLLCWASVLRGRDLHMENVVATSDGPVLIDLEALVQPVRATEAAELALRGGDTSSGATLPASAVESGLLSMIETDAGGTTRDMGGLRGTPAAVAGTIRVWDHLGTDAITEATAPAPAPRAANGVVVAGRRTAPEDYAAEVIDGYRATYHFLVRHRERLLEADGPLARLAGGQVRVLLRNTDQYAQLLQALAAPRYQADGWRRSLWIEILHRPMVPGAPRPRLWALACDERRQLEQLDIPRFWAYADQRVIQSSAGALDAADIARSGLDAVRARVRALDEGELSRHEAELRFALANHTHVTFPLPADSATSPEADAVRASASVLRAAAIAIGEALLARPGAALFPPGSVPGLADAALYRGHLGRAVFFAALARVTDGTGWRDAAADALAPALDAMAAPLSPATATGITSGVGSLVYGLALAGRLLGRPTLLDRAIACSVELDPVRRPDAWSCDLTDGWAGAVLALLSLWDETRDHTVLARAEACGQRLLDAEIQGPAGSTWAGPGGREYLGFAHGSAGIAFAASRLATGTGAPLWTALADRAWRAVESAYAPATGTWPVERGSSPAEPSRYAWCHGSAGVLIGLFRTLDFAGERAILTHASSALTTLQQVQDHLEEHLCCGNLGRAEALLVAGQHLGSPALIAAARALAVRVVERAGRRQHVRLASSGVYYPVVDPGFFRGLSGIGYQLLRTAEPDRLPSALGFA